MKQDALLLYSKYKKKNPESIKLKFNKKYKHPFFKRNLREFNIQLKP